jgi:hypothetical protein
MSSSPVGLKPQTNHPLQSIANYVFNKVLAALKVEVVGDVGDSLNDKFHGVAFEGYESKHLVATNAAQRFTFPVNKKPSMIYIYRDIVTNNYLYASVDEPVKTEKHVPTFIGGTKLFIKKNVDYIEFVTDNNGDADFWLEWYY